MVCADDALVSANGSYDMLNSLFTAVTTTTLLNTKVLPEGCLSIKNPIALIVFSYSLKVENGGVIVLTPSIGQTE